MAGRPSLPSVPVKQASLRKEVDTTFQSISGLIKASLRPLPRQTGDGSYITPPISTGLLQDLRKLSINDVETLIQTVKAEATGDPTDDKTYLMERVIQVESPFTTFKPPI